MLKVYEKYSHGMATTHADVINADLLAFIKADVIASLRASRVQGHRKLREGEAL